MVNFPSDTLFQLRSSSEFRGKRKNSIAQENSKCISISTLIENSSPTYKNVENMWGMLSLNVNSRTSNSVLPVDFVMVIDHSSSMKFDNKLAFVLASIEFCLSQLESHHRFSLILFNHQVTQLTNGLLPMTPENKLYILSKLKEIVATGSTNIGDALISALGVLNSRTDPNVLASVMLFSDGLSNIGLSSGEIQNALQTVTLPESLSIHTFGFGTDHDSALMRRIAFSHHSGVYYYIDNKESIPATFGESLYNVLSTVASNISVQISGQDGCRITRISSRYQYEEKNQLKEYSIKMGSVSLQEKRSILFRLSLRKMTQEIPEHSLLKISVQYKNLLTNVNETVESYLSVSRPDISPPSCNKNRPVELDVQLNRTLAVSAIDDALLLTKQKNDLLGARELIKDTIQSIESSISSGESYCRDLVTDLRQCLNGLCENVNFYGIHYANAYGSMYSSEKSTGCQYLRGLADFEENPLHRHHGYGYATKVGEEASERAKSQAQNFICRYTVEL